jgi:hypothetical protein
MKNVYSSAFTITCAPSHNFLTIHVKMDVFIEMHRNFLQADEGVYVMENGSKIKMEKLIWRKGMVGFRVPGEMGPG